MALSDSSTLRKEFVREVFRKHYDKLSKLRLEILAPYLVTENIINIDDHEIIRVTTSTSDKSAVILRAISSHLDAEYDDSFTLLLDLMYQHGDVVMKKVAGEINQQLNRSRKVIQLSDDQPKQMQEIDFSKYSVDNAFSILTANIYQILASHKIEFEVLRRACIENANTLFGANLPDELVVEIKASDNLNKLFDVLANSSYWNWINIRILIKMVSVSGVFEAKKLVDRYKDAVFSRKLKMLLDQLPALDIPADYYTEIEQKWKKSLDEVTVRDLVKHWSNMEKLFDVKEPTLLLKKVVDGCVEIHWLIPTELVHHICCALFNARQTNKSILYLKVDNHMIVCNDGEAEEYLDTIVAKGDEQLSQSLLVQQLNSNQSIKPSVVEQIFNCLVDFVVAQLLQSSGYEQCLQQCKSLMASDVHKIGLFSDDQLKQLDEDGDNFLLLQNLKSLWMWSDHSVLEALASLCDDAIKVLKQFDNHLNLSQLISAYPIHCISPDMAPSDDSPHTILAVTCDQPLYQCTLQYIFDVRTLLMTRCDITAHSLQMLAARADPTVLYWTIPKCVVSLVITKVLEYHKTFYNEMIYEVSIYPTIRIATSSGRMLGSLVYLSPNVSADDSTETSGPEVLEGAELVTKWLSKPEELFTVFDKLISGMKSKDKVIFQLEHDYHQKSKMCQHVLQQKGQLQSDIIAHKKSITEYRELYEKKDENLNEMLKQREQLEKQLEQLENKLEQLPVTHSTDMEDAVKKLQNAWENFRPCFQGIQSYTSHMETDTKEISEKELKGGEDIGDLTSAKLKSISHEIIEAKVWSNEMKKRNFELQLTLDEKSLEAEANNIKVKQLEAEVEELTVTNKSKVEELKRMNRQLIKKVADLRSDIAKKPHFGTGRYGDTYKMHYKGIWCTGKILHETLVNHSQSTEDLVAEVKKRCNNLHHSNLVTFIGVTEVDKRPAIMTELVEVNLFTYIEQNSKLSPDTQFSLCKDMSRGLEELHKQLLLHKNLHSRNVLIQENRAKLSDYYYSLLQVEGYTPDVMDIAAFIAPEVIKDQSMFSTSSDVFSLGVLFLMVITGKAVVQEHKDLVAISQNHILLPLIQQCLREKIDDRPSAAQIYKAIKTTQDSPQYISFRALEQTESVPLFQAVKAGAKQLEWRSCATLPAPLIGANAVVLGNTIFVSGGESPDDFTSRHVFAYHFLENRWERLSPLTHTHGVPVVIADKLVIIGGKELKNKRVTNQVSTYNQIEQKWESIYPNLGKERYSPLAVTYKHYIIVGGGKYHLLYDRLHDDIELLDIQDTGKLMWKRVPTRLPLKMWSPSATISNDQLWIVGFNNDNSSSLNLIEQRSDEVFWILVADVIATDKKGKWESLPRQMPYYSSIVVPNSYPIVTVGGDTKDASRTMNAIVMHDSLDNLWPQVASLTDPPRAYVTVACIGEQQAIIVLGGCTETKSKKSRSNSSLALVEIGYAV